MINDHRRYYAYENFIKLKIAKILMCHYNFLSFLKSHPALSIPLNIGCCASLNIGTTGFSHWVSHGVNISVNDSSD